MLQSQDQEKIQKMEEIEQIREQVRREMNEEANAFVQQQIQAAHIQMYAEIERQVAERTESQLLQSQFQQMEIPMSQNRS